MKQSKLRKRRVWRYAVLYFVMLVVFVGLIVGPIVAAKPITSGTSSIFNQGGIIGDLIQPVNQNNNDTRGTNQTGTADPTRSNAPVTGSNSVAGATQKIKLF